VSSYFFVGQKPTSRFSQGSKRHQVGARQNSTRVTHLAGLVAGPPRALFVSIASRYYVTPIGAAYTEWVEAHSSRTSARRSRRPRHKYHDMCPRCPRIAHSAPHCERRVEFLERQKALPAHLSATRLLQRRREDGTSSTTANCLTPPKKRQLIYCSRRTEESVSSRTLPDEESRSLF
jgi:hypothetical protein